MLRLGRMLAAPVALPLVAAGPAATILPPAPKPARAPGAAVQPYVRIPARHVALMHVRVIDGSGAPPVEDATVVFDGARIAAGRPAGRPACRCRRVRPCST